MTQYKLVWDWSMSLINDYQTYSTINLFGIVIVVAVIVAATLLIRLLIKSGLFIAALGVVAAIIVGYFVLKSQQLEVAKMCEELVRNGTIQNITDCAIDAIAKVKGG